MGESADPFRPPERSAQLLAAHFFEQLFDQGRGFGMLLVEHGLPLAGVPRGILQQKGKETERGDTEDVFVEMDESLRAHR
jgi:hypothetical protein